jgi:hypothetical protein
MQQPEHGHAKLPLKEMIKSLPGIVGIRLEEKPKFDKLGKEGPVELRRYHPMLVAEISIAGDHAAAVDQGFDRLAKYIFGDNSASEEMAMTNPVLQEPESAEGVELAMTAPVFQEHEEGGPEGSDSWRIAFVMPSKYTLETVPKPLDKDILLVEVPACTTAVVEYSGNNTEEHMQEAASRLQAWLLSSGRVALSPIRWAQYDAPFTIPFLKRNEAMLDVKD